MNASLPKETTLTLVMKLEINTSDLSKHLDWLTRLMMMSVESSEILSAEIFPPLPLGETGWLLVQKFYTLEQIEVWLKSDGRRKLMDEIQPYLDSKQIVISESIDSSGTTRCSISIAVVTHVKEGHEKTYFAYERKYQSAQARTPGYCGAYVQPPTNGSAGIWLTIIRFDSSKSMEQWFASDERKQLVAESDQFVKSTDFQNVTTSFPGWFLNEDNASKGPPNWKTALLILVGLYPSVMLVIKYFLPLLPGYPPALSNFMGNILTVAFTTWVTMPIFITVYKSWLFPTKNTPKWMNAISIISIIFLFAIEIAFFWRFF